MRDGSSGGSDGGGSGGGGGANHDEVAAYRGGAGAGLIRSSRSPYLAPRGTLSPGRLPSSSSLLARRSQTLSLSPNLVGLASLVEDDAMDGGVAINAVGGDVVGAGLALPPALNLNHDPLSPPPLDMPEAQKDDENWGLHPRVSDASSASRRRSTRGDSIEPSLMF